MVVIDLTVFLREGWGLMPNPSGGYITDVAAPRYIMANFFFHFYSFYFSSVQLSSY